MPARRPLLRADPIRRVAPELDNEAQAAAMDKTQANDASGVCSMPGAAALLAAVGERRWAVVTSGTLAFSTARLKAASLPVPEVLIAAEGVSAGKPDPEGYREAALRLGAAVERTVVVEDALYSVAPSSGSSSQTSWRLGAADIELVGSTVGANLTHALRPAISGPPVSEQAEWPSSRATPQRPAALA